MPKSPPFRLARKVAVAVIGFSVVAFGVALIVLPGPAILVIPLGLAILATEFLRAGQALGGIRNLGRKLVDYASDWLGSSFWFVAGRASGRWAISVPLTGSTLSWRRQLAPQQGAPQPPRPARSHSCRSSALG